MTLLSLFVVDERSYTSQYKQLFIEAGREGLHSCQLHSLRICCSSALLNGHWVVVDFTGILVKRRGRKRDEFFQLAKAEGNMLCIQTHRDPIQAMGPVPGTFSWAQLPGLT